MTLDDSLMEMTCSAITFEKDEDFFSFEGGKG